MAQAPAVFESAPVACANCSEPFPAPPPRFCPVSLGVGRAGLRDGVFFCTDLPAWVCKRIQRRIDLKPEALAGAMVIALAMAPWGWMSGLAMAAVPVYAWLSMGRVYGGRRWPRLWRAGVVSGLYMVTLALAMMGVGVWAFLV